MSNSLPYAIGPLSVLCPVCL